MKTKPPVSERRSQAARENGRKSRGPVTARGKAASSRNSTTHGLCAKAVLLDDESPVTFNRIARGIHEEYRPETPSEVAAVDAIVYARWRQLRLWAVERSTLNNAIRESEVSATDPCSCTAKAWVGLGDNSNALSLFARYETLYERQFARALRRLEAIRAFRKSENNERTRQLAEMPAPDPLPEPADNPA